jgi:hypothetical protein
MVRFLGVYGSRLDRVGTASPGNDAALFWVDTPSMPVEGAVISIVFTDGIELDAWSCLRDKFSLRTYLQRLKGSPVVVPEVNLIHHMVPFPIQQPMVSLLYDCILRICCFDIIS